MTARRAALARATIGWLASTTLAACVDGGDPTRGMAIGVLEGVREESFPATLDVGAVFSVAESPSVLAVAGERGLGFFDRGTGTTRATGPSVLVSLTPAPATLVGAAFVGARGDGALVTLTDDAAATDVTARFALAPGKARAVADLGGFGLGIGLSDGYALALDGTVQRASLEGVRALFTCQLRLFVRTDAELYRLGPDGRPAFKIAPAEGLTGAGCDPHGRLVVTTPVALYREGDGALAPLVEAMGFGHLVPTSTGNAFLKAGALCILDDAGLRCESGERLFTELFAARTGLPWASRGKALLRLTEGGPDGGIASDSGVPFDSATDAATDADADADAGSTDGAPRQDGAPPVDGATGGDEATWVREVKPIAERVCFGCHSSVAAAGPTLTTHASWVTMRETLRDVLVRRRSMPPSRTALSDAERAVLAGWLGP